MTEVIAVPTTTRLTAAMRMVVREAEDAAPWIFCRAEIRLEPRSAAGRRVRLIRVRRDREELVGPERFVTGLCSHARQRMRCHLDLQHISGERVRGARGTRRCRQALIRCEATGCTSQHGLSDMVPRS